MARRRLRDGQVVDRGDWTVRGTDRVFVSGTAAVEAHDRTTVHASGLAMVTARGECRVWMADQAEVLAWDDARVQSIAAGFIDSSEVHDRSTFHVRGRVDLYAYDSSRVVAMADADGDIDLYDRSRALVGRRTEIHATGGSRVMAVDDAIVEAQDFVRVVLEDRARIGPTDDDDRFAPAQLDPRVVVVRR